MTETFFSPWGIPAHMDMGSISNRIGLMFNEDNTDLSSLAAAARNTQWADFSRPERSRLQKGLAEILNRHIFREEVLGSRRSSSSTPFIATAHDKRNTHFYALSVVEALNSGECDDLQVHAESWALGVLIEKLSPAARDALIKDMVELVASASNEENQIELVKSLGVENYADLTSPVVVSEDLGYADVMKAQRSSDAVRRTGFVPVPALF